MLELVSTASRIPTVESVVSLALVCYFTERGFTVLCACAFVLQLLHPQVTLQLCFLACALLREGVTCYDIITWALDAQLPFLELPDIAKACLSGEEGGAGGGHHLDKAVYPGLSLCSLV